MTTRTQNDVRNFNEAINKCRMPVFLVSSDGTRYNMKSADQNVAGMDRWIRDFSHQMEIFTCDLEDEMIMMRYLLNRFAKRPPYWTGASVRRFAIFRKYS